MPRFSIERRDGTLFLRDEDRRHAIVAGPYTQLYEETDAIELRDLLLREFPLDAREANQFYVAGLRYALEWTQGRHAKSVIEAEIRRHSYRSASHDRWDP